MIIQRIEIKNFRSLKSIDVHCESLVAILGRNGAGKSTILRALDVFYDPSAHISEFDFFDKDSTLEISMRVTFGELSEIEREEFASYLTENTLIVTKVMAGGNARYYAASNQLPEFVEMRAMSVVPKRKSFTELVSSGKYLDLTAPPKSAQAVEEAMLAFESGHPELLQPYQKETQFFGPKNIGGGKLDKYTKFVLIPAVRDALSETERKGAILQLIDMLVMRSVNARPDVRELNADFEKRVREVFNTENLSELKTLGTLITSVLKKYAPGAEFDLSFEEMNLPQLGLPNAIPSLVEDNFKCPINYCGHGLQRALIFALLHQLSITDRPPDVQEENATEGPVQHTANRGPDLILAIEEPELYLHPSRCRYLSRVMLQLSKPNTVADARTQIIYCTHSPYFVGLERFNQVRLVRKMPTVGTQTLQSTITSCSRESVSRQLAEISRKNVDLFTEASFSAHVSPVMTTIVNEGFFCDVVVVVEGDAEAGALWAIQEIQSRGWDALGISVIPADGKNNIDRPVVIFRGLNIKTFFVFDGDSNLKGDAGEGAKKTNWLLQRLAGVDPVDFPATGVFDEWAVFHAKLESEIEQALGEKDFNDFRVELATSLGYDQPSSVLKNSEGTALFLKKVYSVGKRIPILECIVEAITKLAVQSPASGQLGKSVMPGGLIAGVKI